MQSSVEAEGDKDKKLFEEFMCYCKTGTGDLTKSITAAENKIPQVESALAAAEASKEQLEKDLAQHKANVATATALREKEAAAFAKESSDLKTNIAALAKATAAIEGGMAGSFLQNAAATAALQKM